MPNREIIEAVNESVRVAQTNHSDWSNQQTITIATDTTIPSPPVITVTASAGSVTIAIDPPTTNTDGSAIVDILEYKIYYYGSAGIDITNSATYIDPPYTMSATAKMHPCSAQTYIVATCIDKWGNESVASNEANAVPSGIDPSLDGLWAHRLGSTASWTEGTPATGVTWADVILYWKDTSYVITGGSTTNKYIWWDYSASTTTFQTTDTLPTLELEDALIAYNDSGTLHLSVYRPMFFADYMRAGVLQSTNYAAAVGSELDLDAGTLTLGGSDGNGVVLSSDGSAAFGSDLTWDTDELIMLGTLKTSSAVDVSRLTMFGTKAGAAEKHKLIAFDTGNKGRVVFSTSSLEVFESDGSTTLSVFPSTPATIAFIGNDELIVNNTLIVGRNTDPSTTDILHVTGTGLFTSTVVVGDHDEDDTPSVVNVLFYTTTPPTASTTPRGTIAYQVPA